ncbi:hypothetical protein AC249_AIPGENE20152 [Exaiptasia diaphana]|nr:hypothetical protein AC249_AIPGENE20152 [Exaiptasia diaphana]
MGTKCNDTIQKRLLSSDYEKLTFTKAFEIATSIELATSGAKNIQQQVSAPPVSEVHKVETRELSKIKKSCYCCGDKHNQEHCPFKDKSCFFCGKEGHIAKVCKAKQRSQQASSSSRPINQVSVDEKDEPDQTYNLFTLSGNSMAYKTTLCIDGHHLEMEIDTGSAVTLISKNTFSKFFKEKKLENTNAKLRTYTGEDVNVIGTTPVQWKVSN